MCLLEVYFQQVETTYTHDKLCILNRCTFKAILSSEPGCTWRVRQTPTLPLHAKLNFNACSSTRLKKRTSLEIVLQLSATRRGGSLLSRPGNGRLDAIYCEKDSLCLNVFCIKTIWESFVTFNFYWSFQRTCQTCYRLKSGGSQNLFIRKVLSKNTLRSLLWKTYLLEHSYFTAYKYECCKIRMLQRVWKVF